MHILISNDDGYMAPGISALANEMRRFGRVSIVAPEHNHSGSSNALTLNKPLTVTNASEDVFVVSGTPSDCVHLALTGLLDDRPDLVVSGINCGANMGDDTMYSGTVAAAIEGYIFGIDSIAFSQIDKGWAELPSAAAMAGKIVFAFPAGNDGFFNDYPGDDSFAGRRLVRFSGRHYNGRIAGRYGDHFGVYTCIVCFILSHRKRR